MQLNLLLLKCHGTVYLFCAEIRKSLFQMMLNSLFSVFVLLEFAESSFIPRD